METNAKCMTFDDLKPGQRVRVHQMIDRRAGDWSCTVEGVIQDVEVSKTGSWYAHGKDDKLWLRRIRLMKDGGELSTLNVDQWTEVELLP
jgi:hypothetical protein